MGNTIRIIRADITQLDVDIIVNSAHSTLVAEVGVAEAMFGIDSKVAEQILSHLDDDMIKVIRDFCTKYNVPNQIIN